MLRPIWMPAWLLAAALLSAVGCQACSSCYDYARPVADCQCNCCGCQRAGSVHCCGCNSGGCESGNCTGSGEYSGEPEAVEGAVQQGQPNPAPQSMYHGPATAQ